MDEDERKDPEASPATGAAEEPAPSPFGQTGPGPVLAEAAPGRLPVAAPQGGPLQAEVNAAAEALVRGDFRLARRLARGVAADARATQPERSFALEALRRTDIDPVALAVGVASFVIFLLIVYLTLGR